MIKNMQQLKYLIRESLNIHNQKILMLRESLEDDLNDYDDFDQNEASYNVKNFSKSSKIKDIYDEFLQDNKIDNDEIINNNNNAI